jgi:paraquat-inducible protein A
MHYQSSPANLVICEYCDAVHTRSPLQRREIAHCQHCGSELYRHSHLDLGVMMALTVASTIMFVIANCYPIVALNMQGLSSQATLWETLLFTLDSNVGAIAVLAAGSAFFFPLIQILLFAYVLIPLRAGRRPAAFIGAMHALRQLRPWSMVEVFMLGAVVSVVKLTAVADVAPQIGLWGFAALTLLLTALSSFDLHELWECAAEIEA